MRTCCVCKEIKELNCFHRDKGRRDGLQSTCKDCKKLLAQKRYANNPEYHSDMSKKWRKENPEKSKQLTKDWKKRTEYLKKHREKYHDNWMNYDSHYKKILVAMGFKNPPQELIDLKRTQIKIIRLCKTEK